MRVPCWACLGIVFLWGWSAVAQDPADQAALAKECKKGKADSCLQLGLAILDADPKRAAGLFKTACDKGSLPSCDNLGLMTAQGLGIDGNDAKAAALFTKGCAKKFGLSCLHLSAMHAEGFGVALDVKKAVSLSSQACDLGSPVGCERAAGLYRTAELGPDAEKADSLDAKAKELRGGKSPDPSEGGGWGDKPR